MQRRSNHDAEGRADEATSFRQTAKRIKADFEKWIADNEAPVIKLPERELSLWSYIALALRRLGKPTGVRPRVVWGRAEDEFYMFSEIDDALTTQTTEA
jgi:hypothetical protein